MSRMKSKLSFSSLTAFGTLASRNVYPSGGAFTTSSVPILPAAPGRFSTSQFYRCPATMGNDWGSVNAGIKMHRLAGVKMRHGPDATTAVFSGTGKPRGLTASARTEQSFLRRDARCRASVFQVVVVWINGVSEWRRDRRLLY